MSQATDGGNESRGTGAEGEGAEQLQQSPRTVLFRKSCDLCVRLKRACDGKNPCQLCQRRRETCTRSVKRKSGPAKGTKYSTRRQRLEAGIPDRAPPRSRAGKGRGVGNVKLVDDGTVAVSAAVASNAAAHPPPVSSVGHEVGSSQGVRGGMSIRGRSPISLAMGPLQDNHHGDAGRGGRGRVVESGGNSVEGGGGDVGGVVVKEERGLGAHRPSVGGDQGLGGGLEPRSPRGGFVADSPRGRSGEESGGSCNGGGNGSSQDGGAGGAGDPGGHGLGDGAHGVLPRRAVSPLCLPMLPWSSGGEGTGDADQSRGRSTSPFGLLPGPPSHVGRVRRGGTREPPVEASAGASHFWVPPPPKRFRMSGREPVLGSQEADHGAGNLNGIPLGLGGDRAQGGNDVSSGAVVGGQDGFRPTLRDPREQSAGFPSLGGVQGGQLLTHASFSSAPMGLAAFDSAPATQTPYASAVERRSNGNCGGNGGRLGADDGVEHQLHQTSAATTTGVNGTEHSRVGQRPNWGHPTMRVLPPPATGMPGRAAQVAGDTLLSRVEGAGGDGSNMTATRWRGSDIPVGDTGNGSEAGRVEDGDNWRDKSSPRPDADAGLGEGHREGGVSGRREGGEADGGSTRRGSRELLAGRGVSQAPWNSSESVVSSVPLPDNACGNISRSWSTTTGTVSLPNTTTSSETGDGNPSVTGGSSGVISGNSLGGNWEFNTGASFRRQGNGAAGVGPAVSGAGDLNTDGDGRGGNAGAPSSLPPTSGPERAWVGNQLGMVTSSPSPSVTKATASREETKARLLGPHQPQSPQQPQGRIHALPSVETFAAARGDEKNPLSAPSTFSLSSGSGGVVGPSNASEDNGVVRGGSSFNSFRGGSATSANNGCASGSNGVVSVPAAATALEVFRGSGSLPAWTSGGGGGVQQGLTAPPSSHREASAGETYFPPTAAAVSGVHAARAESWVSNNGGAGPGRQDGSNIPLVNADVAAAAAVSVARTREPRLGKAAAPAPNSGWHVAWGPSVHGHVQRAGFEREGASWPSEYSI